VFLSDRVLVMSGRPSTILETIAIDSDRPRSIDKMVSDKFGAYVSHMRHLMSRKDPA